jgi:hypothetical protein
MTGGTTGSGSLAMFTAIGRAPWRKKKKALGAAWGTLPRAALGVCVRGAELSKPCTKEIVSRLTS